MGSIARLLRMRGGRQKRTREMAIGKKKLDLLLLALRMEEEGQKPRHGGRS